MGRVPDAPPVTSKILPLSGWSMEGMLRYSASCFQVLLQNAKCSRKMLMRLLVAVCEE
jgi:hypothetical protein